MMLLLLRTTTNNDNNSNDNTNHNANHNDNNDNKNAGSLSEPRRLAQGGRDQQAPRRRAPGQRQRGRGAPDRPAAPGGLF